MNIHMPGRGNRDLPKTTKPIESVLRRFCTKTGLNPENLTLTVAGGNWEHRIQKHGVRIISFTDKNPFSVHVLIGCEQNSIRGYIAYRENGTSVRAQDLHGRLSKFFENGGKEKFIAVPEEKPSEGAAERSTGITKETEPTGDMPAPAEEKADSVTEAPPVPPIQEPQEPTQLDYKHFFDNKSNLHLAVVALVAKFQPHQLFTFEDFADTLRNDVGIKLESMKMASMTQRFINGGFMVKRSKPGVSARYSITEKAQAYAAETVTDASASVKQRPQHESKLETTSLRSLMAQFAELQKHESRYQAILAQVAVNDSTLSGMKLTDLQREKGQISGEIASLNTRIATLRRREEEIQAISAKASSIQTETIALQEKLRSKDIAARHAEFMQMKAELTELQNLMGNAQA
ncbi:MAG: hypothetical protein AAB365_01640 [Patescibacteria group bacterium]